MFIISLTIRSAKKLIIIIQFIRLTKKEDIINFLVFNMDFLESNTS